MLGVQARLQKNDFRRMLTRASHLCGWLNERGPAASSVSAINDALSSFGCFMNALEMLWVSACRNSDLLSLFL